MLGDCVITGEEGTPSKMSDKSSPALKSPASSILTSPPPTKKLKQARLSFKVLEPKPLNDPKITPTPGKKRKPSDGAVPQRAAKIQKSGDENARGPPRAGRHEDAENEVSSSSEAEAAAKGPLSPDPKATEKRRGLDRFVQSTQQLEVSTSCEDVVDLTSEEQEAPPVKADKDQQELKQKAVESTSSCNDAENMSVETKDEKIDCNELKTTQHESREVEEEVKERKPEEEDVQQPKEETLTENNNDTKINDCDKSDDTLDSMMDTSDMISQSLNESTETTNDSDNESEGKDTSPATPSTPGSRVLKRPPLTSTQKNKKDDDRLKKKEEREKAKEEKQRQKELEKQKKEEQRKEKERQRLEKEKQKKEEKERKEAEKLQKEKERQEKQAEKEKEKEEKNRQKEEERKKKQEAIEAKQEEKKRKEEEKEAERKRKEEEKQRLEEEKLKKLQPKQTLSKFFKKVEPAKPVKVSGTVGPFAAFHVLANMKMAPAVRVAEDRLPELRDGLDTHLQQQSATSLYLDLLRSGAVKPGASERTWPADDDLIVMEDSNDKPAPRHKAKLLKFQENYRPAYFGTWRKRSKTISPRNPFRKDEVYLDYEVDSDDEWEEEEPGESLSNSEGEGEDGDKEENDDSDEDGFFVPHGYLSDGEGCEEDEEDGNPEKMKMRQMIKAKAWEAELKRQTEVLHKLVIGCRWWAPDDTPDPQLAQYSASILVDESPIMIREGPSETTKKSGSGKTPKSGKETRGIKKQEVPDEAMPHLIRLVHGNTASLKKLIREFRVFWSRHLRKGNNGAEKSGESKPSGLADTSMEVDPAEVQKGEEGVAGSKEEPSKDVSMDTDVDEIDGASAISKRQLDIKIREFGVYKKRDTYRIKCWYVNEATLEKYGLKDLPVPTKWEWVTRPNLKQDPADPATLTPAGKKPGKDAGTPAAPNNPSIKQFAVPGLIHAHTPEATQTSTPKSKTVTPSPGTQPNSSKKTPKRITPITLFCAKQPSADSALKDSRLKEASTNVDLTKPASSQKPAPTSSAPLKPTSVGDDDDCMIVDEEFVPPPPSKSQPTLLSMFPPKATA